MGAGDVAVVGYGEENCFGCCVSCFWIGIPAFDTFADGEENTQLASENRAIRKEITVRNSSSEADKSPSAPKHDREQKIAKESPFDTSDLPPYVSIFNITIHPGTSDIETICFRDGCNLSSSDSFPIFPGSKTTNRRVRAARALLCTPHTILDSATNTPLPNPPTQKLVELMLRPLSSKMVLQHASTPYAVGVEEMAWLRETGIRKLGEHMGVDVEPLFPDIMSESKVDRRRALMSLREEGDEGPRAKRSRVEEDEEVSEESSEEEEDDDDDYDESYTEESSRRRSHRRKVSVETTSSEPTRRDTPVKRPSPTISRPHFKPTNSLPTSQLPRTPDDITTNIDGTQTPFFQSNKSDSVTRIFRLCREHKTQLLKCNMLRAKRDALQTQKEDTTAIKEDIRKAVSKRKSLKKQAKREKMKCQREFLLRQNLGFRKVFEQFESEFFGLECGVDS
jgi:hypothetical protein